MFYKKIKLVLLFVILSVSLSACSLAFKDKEPDNSQKPLIDEVVQDDNNDKAEEVVEKTGKMKKFTNFTDFEDFLLANSSNLYPEINSTKEPVVSLSYFSDDSVNNLKTPDLVVYENNFAFALVKDKVKVMRLGGEENVVLSEIKFDSRPIGLILKDKSLIVYGQDELLAKSENSPFYYVQIFNLDQPAEPKLINSYSFEGQIKNLFVANGHFYLITETESKSELSKQRLAKVYRNDVVLSSSCDGASSCFSPEVFYFDLDYSQVRLLNINVIDLNNAFSDVTGSVYLLNEDHRAYISDSSVFISSFKSFKEDDLKFEAKRSLVYDKLSDAEKNKIIEIEILSDFVLNKAEKQKRVELILDSFIVSLTSEEKTTLDLDISIFVEKTKNSSAISDENKIHKIRLEQGNIDYFAVGKIKGEIFNNYSILEKDGFVYLGTNSGERLNSSNELRHYVNIYILDSTMKQLGKIENLASKESLYGVRFVGDRAFLVSSEEEGSLFIVSLSDKYKPVFEGVVKLPGKNIQLFPVDKDANKLISLARYNEVDNEKNRIKLSLLDISNLKEPKELDSYLLGEFMASSISFSDKRSFFYSPNSSLITVPVSLEKENKLYFSGIFAFKVLNDKLEMKGQVDHSVAGFYNSADNFSGFSYFDNSVKRSFVIRSYRTY